MKPSRFWDLLFSWPDRFRERFVRTPFRRLRPPLRVPLHQSLGPLSLAPISSKLSYDPARSCLAGRLLTDADARSNVASFLPAASAWSAHVVAQNIEDHPHPQ